MDLKGTPTLTSLVLFRDLNAVNEWAGRGVCAWCGCPQHDSGPHGEEAEPEPPARGAELPTTP